MTKNVVVLVSVLLSLTSFSFSAPAEDFGAAQPYNALVFGDFTATASDVEGRLAAGGNIFLQYYGVGYRLNTTLPDGVLVAGGDITFPAGQVYHGDILAGGSAQGVEDSVRDSLAEGAAITDQADLPIDFSDIKAELTQMSEELAALDANGSAVYQWGGLYMTAACDADVQVFQLDGEQLLAANAFSVDLSCAPDNATYIFNISGIETGMTNMGLQSLESVRDHVVYNFYQATSLTFQSVGVQGSVLAPLADLDNPAGVIYGQLFANSWNGPMQIDLAPFTGNLPRTKVNEPPIIVSSPVVATPEHSEYQYRVEVSDPDDDLILYTLDLAPAEMSIEGSDGLIRWLPQDKYVQTVPTFNGQCYEVPAMPAKIYEEGDDASGLEYSAPLFERVRKAIAKSSLFVAPAAVSWHESNDCLGCYIQAQTLLGLQSAMDKAEVDEGAATYLLNELVNSQLSNGSISLSHPEYAEIQTMFALWALSFVHDPAVTFNVRAKALAFLWNQRQSDNGLVYWSNDSGSGWLNNVDAMTALVTLSASRYIEDALEQDNLVAEQQEVVDHYSAVLGNIADFVLGRAHQNEDSNLPNAFRLVALGELQNVLKLVSPHDARLAVIAADMHDLDALLRARQEEDGGWNLNASGDSSDPLISAWVGLALDYLSPNLTDKSVLNNIEYLISSQQPDGTWLTNSGLFTKPLATTSLVMTYLPVALEHLGSPDVSAGHILLTEIDDSYDLLSVVIKNRGLAGITVPVVVNFYNGSPEDNDLLGSVSLDQIASNHFVQPSISVSDDKLTDDIYVTLAVDGTANECEISNNQTIAALVRVRATDPGNLSDTQVYTLNVDDVNQAPVITSVAPTDVQGGQSLNYQITSTDDDVADAHTYTLVRGPVGLYLNPHTGRITSAPGGIEPGTYTVLVEVADLRGATVEQSFTIVVHENLPPQITSEPVIRGNDATGYDYDVEAIDPNSGDILRYTYIQGPDGLQIDAASGVMDWNDIQASLHEGRLDNNEFCIGQPQRSIGLFEPVVKWSKDQYDIGGRQVKGPVLVGQMTDDNGDGVIDVLDNTDIVMIGSEGAPTFVAVVDGATGAPHWISFDYNNNAMGSAAIADLDKDGKPEIYVLSYRRQTLLVIDNEGNLIREVETGLPYSTLSDGTRDGVTIADLDEDGSAEIIVGRNVLNADGTIKWKGTRDYGGDKRYALVPVVADINLDGQQEVIAGRTIYSSAGEVLSHNTSIPSDGFNAIGNFNDDDYAEIVTVGNGSVSLRDHNGQLIWGPASVPGGGYGGPPTIGDFDGDGLSEIGIAGANYYVVYEHDGTLKWKSQTRDASSHRTGSSLFDFEGDGTAEVVYADEYFLRVYDGSTGEVRMEVENSSGTTLEYPVIADIDNDGHAEILVGSNQHGGLRAFEDANDSWAPTRAIWNQHAYHIDNINDDLTVPTHPVKSWLTHNTFRLNAFPNHPVLGLADLTVHDIAYDEAAQTLSAWVKNRGLAPVDELITVSFFHEHLQTGDQALGQVMIDRLEMGEDAQISLTVDSSILQNIVRVDVTAADDVIECITDNNHARAAMIEARVYDEAGLYDSQSFAVSIADDLNSAPNITSSASSQATAGEDYRFQLETSDADLGDDVQFSLVDAPDVLSIGRYSGVLSATDLVEGIYTITIRAEDLSGAAAEQVHFLTVSPVDNNAPVIESDPVTAVTAGQAYVYDVLAHDPDGDELIYLLSRSQPGMTIVAETGQIRWIPGNDDVGVKSAEVTVTDINGAATKQYFLIDVADANEDNHPPVINSVPSGVVYAGQYYEYQVEANDPDDDSLTYALNSSVSGMSISTTGQFTWLPSVNLVGQSVIVEIQVSDGKGGTATQKLTLPVNESANHGPVITSTPQTGSLVSQPFTYDVEAEDPDDDILNYRLDQAPNGMSIDADSGLIAWLPDTNGDFPVTVVVSDGVLEVTQTFTITVVLPNQSPTITSTPVTTVRQGLTYRYQITATDPEGEAINYALASSPAGMQIDTATGLLTWTPGVDQVGVHGVEVTAFDSQANTSTQSYLLSVVTGTGNTPPHITSSPSGNAIFEQAYEYDVEAIDPDGDALTYRLVSAPPGMNIDSLTGLIGWTPSTGQAGTYAIEVRVEDELGGHAVQSYSLTVTDGSTANALPVIQSLPGTLARTGLEYRYSVQATDADGDDLSYSLSDAPSGMLVDDAGEIAWTPAGEETVSVTLRVSDGLGYVTQSWIIDVLAADAILSAQLAITPDSVAEGDTVTLRVIPENAVAPLSVTLDVDGNPLSLDASYQTQIQASGLGTHAVTATVTDAYATVTESGSFLVRDPNSTTVPVVTLVSPADASEITAPTPVVASIEDDDLVAWELWLAPPGVDTVDLTQATLLASGSGVVSNQAIGQLDPTLLMNGQHRLYLRAVDAGGNEGRADSVVQVTGDMKLGHFSITFKDLEVPVAGIPITITRTYDSRRRNQSLDFGRGWSVGYQDVFVQESRPAGFNWFLDSYASGPLGVLTTYCVRPYGDNIVTVTLPDGDVERFRAVATPECNEAMPILDVEIVFEALDGTDSTLEALDNTAGRLVNQHLVDPGDPGTPLDVNRYRLTTREGQSYELEQGIGIRTLTVPSGDVLTFSENGITHSSGAAVAFVRDFEGRIEQIEAPDGTRLTYAYNTDGDLTDFIDQADEVTHFTYINDHYLQDIVDARGVRAIRNLYNDEGRLIGQIDAQGNEVHYSHDLSGRTQTVTDRRGNSRILVFNERGDILAETNALGETHQRTYDAYGDELSHTDPLGNVTVSTYDNHGNQLTESDPLGRTKTWTYSRYNQVTSETADDGRVTNFEYRNYIIRGGFQFDKAGPLISLTDGLDNQTQLGYAVNGYQPLSLIDAESQTTQYAYDSQGRMIRETAPDGSVTEYSRDALGRILTETRTRSDGGATLTEVTRHAYDAAGRRTSTTDPLGHTTRTEYDAAGQVSAEIDALGQRTEYTYDERGNQTRIRYPDGTTEIRNYDEENNLIAQTDREGQTTGMVYDAANRLTETVYPDATPGNDSDNPRSRNEYDAAGRLIAEIDALGHRTEHAYDAVGQRIRTTDALDQVTRFEYDEHGNRTAMIDALNRRTEYVYDAADRLIETRYPDLSVNSTTYDRVGRRTAGTDQATLSTQYVYDEQGRLTQVTDALGGTTSYTYDEAGNKLTQTDAENRTTSWTYDSLGRVLSRTLPLGQQETFVYDANGNLVSHTDFNGNTTTHQYDSDNRRIRSEYADGNREVYSYDAVGNRLSAELTRADGDVASYYYSYDASNRLETETQPDGTVLSYVYDLAGNRTQVRVDLSNGTTQTTEYGYDSLNRLQSVTDAEGTTSYGYDAVGNRTSVSYPNGSSEIYQYDTLNRLTRKETYDGTGALVAAYDYTLNAVGRRTQIDEADGRVTHYGYDDLYRLTSEQISDSQNGDYTASYQYDGVGNRTYSTVNGVQTAYSYDANDRLTQQGGTRYTYDANGNTLSETLDTDTVGYGYNAKNELISVEQNGATTRYDYNPNGIRTAKSAGGVNTRYVVDENRDYAQVLVEQDGTDSIVYTYGDDLISQSRNGVASYYHYDGLGSTRSLTDSLGNLSDHYDYEAFGEVLNRTGSTENEYLFAGEQFDSSLDQYYLRARYYNPASGRFTQQDTWMGNNYDPVSLHKYLYANVDPVSNVDPSGNFSLGSIGTAINVMGTLSTVASTTYSVFQIATGEKEFSALELGSEIILSRLGGAAVNKALGLVGRKSKEVLKNTFDWASCFFNSFPAGTLVHTKFGKVAIEDIKIGDEVLSYNEISHETSYEKVTHLIRNEKEYNFVIVTLENGEVLEATPEHPFYSGQEWKQANELAVSDKLQFIDDVGSISEVGRNFLSEKVFNITVNNAHTFYVGIDGVLVHNASKNSGCKLRGRKAKGFDWDHIFDRHSVGGQTAQHRTRIQGNTTFPSNLTTRQIQARVKAAWKNRELRRSQTDSDGITRLLYEGVDPKSGSKVQMWFNANTQIVETAFPVL